MTRLVGYGCSHTAGSELADHIMLDTDIKTCDELKRKYKEIGLGKNMEKSWVQLTHMIYLTRYLDC